MNETLHADGKSDVPWPTSDYRVPVPATSMLPGSEKAPTAAMNLLNHAVQGAHQAVDQIADRAAPIAREVGEHASAASDAVHAKTAQLKAARDEWVESLRSSVRSNPLVAVAAAVALGAVLARFTRITR
jgi:UDP-N-acetylmuramyl pentapeptide synthase